jgi:nucleoside-diphosphate-sugar epimerase
VITERVLVTGAFGLVGSAVVAALADQGRPVVATELDLPANRKRAIGCRASRDPGAAVGRSDLRRTHSHRRVRDVAQAFTATVTDHLREIFLIGGDGTHRVTRAGLGSELASAMGLVGRVAGRQAR